MNFLPRCSFANNFFLFDIQLLADLYIRFRHEYVLMIIIFSGRVRPAAKEQLVERGGFICLFAHFL